MLEKAERGGVSQKLFRTRTALKTLAETKLGLLLTKEFSKRQLTRNQGRESRSLDGFYKQLAFILIKYTHKE